MARGNARPPGSGSLASPAEGMRLVLATVVVWLREEVADDVGLLQDVVDDEVGHVSAQRLAGLFVVSEVLPCEDGARRRLIRRCEEAG